MRPLEPGDPRSVGRYRVLARAGAGGMAMLYLGQSPDGRAAAIKVMYANFAADPEFRAHFRHEVTYTAAAGGRYSPAVLGADPDADIPWLALEFLPSVTLRAAIRDFGVLPERSIRPLGAGIAEALAAIHQAGIAHLDVKPANVLLTAGGPRMIDFGIARKLGSSPVTTDGTTAGSPGFMSPEQHAGAPAQPPSDVFALGATLAYACTGARQTRETLHDITDQALRYLIARCMDQRAASRPTLAEVMDELYQGDLSAEPWPPAVSAEIHRRAEEAAAPPLDPQPQPTAPRRLNRRALLLGAGALAVGGGGGIFLLSGEKEPQAASSPNPVETFDRAPRSIAPVTRSFELSITGDVRLATLSYGVNDKRVTLTDVQLPHRWTTQIPIAPEVSTYFVDLSYRNGTVTWRVLVNGFPVSSQKTSAGNALGGTGGPKEGTI